MSAAPDDAPEPQPQQVWKARERSGSGGTSSEGAAGRGGPSARSEGVQPPPGTSAELRRTASQNREETSGPRPEAKVSQRATEDVGYETAKIKGVDVLCQVAVMLRQRGLRIVRVVDIDLPAEEPNAAPLAEPPDAAATARYEQWMLAVLAAVSPASLLRACAPTVNATEGGSRAEAGSAPPVVPVITARLCAPEAPPGTAARLHLDRGLASHGDLTAVFMLPVGKIGVKQLRVVRDAIVENPGAILPARIIVATREKIPAAALEVLRKLGVPTEGPGDPRLPERPVLPEQFRLSELSYNLTRHYLQPRHRLCSPEEVAALRRSFPKLALLSREDAVTRFYGLLSGDVMVFHRRRSVGLGGDYYREVA
jgi:DNA-directed RNA polymerase subunit H (RpoH/RPB5)